MLAYLIRRVTLIVPTLLLVTVIVFGGVRMIPGNVIDIMVREMSAESGMGDELDAEHLREVLGLNVPVHVQYIGWIAKIFQGDLGRSLWTNRAVTEIIADRIPVSFELGFMAVIIGTLIGIPVGVYSAVRQDTISDYFGRSIAIVALSVPNFWVATMIIVFPSIWWGWSPPAKYIPIVEDPIVNLGQFILPACIMGMHMSGGIMRMTRTMMLEVMRQDYIRTAWAKGLKERVVVVRHSLKNALIPVVTQIGMLIPFMVAGAVVTEQIFSLPGMGQLLVLAIQTRDYPVISGVNLTLATVILFNNLLVDLTYSYLNPKIRFR